MVAELEAGEVLEQKLETWRQRSLSCVTRMPSAVLVQSIIRRLCILVDRRYRAQSTVLRRFPPLNYPFYRVNVQLQTRIMRGARKETHLFGQSQSSAAYETSPCRGLLSTVERQDAV